MSNVLLPGQNTMLFKDRTDPDLPCSNLNEALLKAQQALGLHGIDARLQKWAKVPFGRMLTIAYSVSACAACALRGTCVAFLHSV